VLEILLCITLILAHVQNKLFYLNNIYQSQHSLQLSSVERKRFTQ